jgi:chromosome segregation ATPase
MITWVGSAVVGGAIGFVFWFIFEREISNQDRAVARQAEKIDGLTGEITRLRDDRVARIETDIVDLREENDKRHSVESEKRAKIHDQIAVMQSNYVTQQRLDQELKRVTDELAQFRIAVTDLARVGEQVKMTAAFVAEVNDRQIALAQDLARIQGRIHPA